MKVEVRFYSRSGNTKKLADAIAGAAQTTAKPISEKLTQPVDILFLGGSIYAGALDKELKDFVIGLNAKQVKKIVVFGTAAGPKSIQPQVKSLLEGKDIIVLDEYFQCRGKFLLAHMNRPNADDLNDAKAFAIKIIR